MAEGRPDSTNENPAGLAATPSWGAWFAWAWLALVVAAALAEVLGLTDLRLALDFQR